MIEGSQKNIAHLRGERKFTHYDGELKDQDVVDKLVADNDVVFHMAAHANFRTSIVDHRADLNNNLVATLNILEAMSKL